MKRKTWLIISLFIILFGFNCFNLTQNVNATSDINYTFQDNIFYDNSSIEFDKTFNFKNESIATEVYEATYSFTNEVGLTSDSISFVSQDYSGADTSVIIIDHLDGHSEVLELYDNSISKKFLISNLISYQNYGSIEFYFRTDDTDMHSICNYYNDTIILFGLMVYSDEFFYYNGSWISLEKVPVVNTWYHILINFECTNGHYQDLDQYNWNLKINGEQYGDYNYANNETCINKFEIKSETMSGGYKSYYDAIGYSWEAIYDFTDDEIGSVPEGWSKDSELDASIVNNYQGHSKVLFINESTVNDKIIIQQFNEPQSEGIITIEFWYNQDMGTQSAFGLAEYNEGWISMVTLLQTLSALNYWNGSNWVFLITLSDNVWYHLKLVLDVDLEIYDVYINNVLKLDDEDFKFSITTAITHFRYSCSAFADGENTYFDAISYSWESVYTINDNIVPIFNTTDNLIIEKDEFAYDENGIQFDIGDTDACGWISTYTPVNSAMIYYDDNKYDRTFRIYQTTDDILMLNKQTYDYNYRSLINISISIPYLEMNNENGAFLFYIAEQDDTNNIVNIYIVKSGSEYLLKYQSSGDVITLASIDTSFNLERKIFLFINNGICLLSYWDENTPITFYSFDNNRLNEGFGRMYISSSMPDTSHTQKILVDSISILVNGTSIVEDYGVSLLNLDSPTWYSKRNNIINVNALGIFSITVYSATDSASLKEFYNYTNTKTWNVYNYFSYMSNPSFSIISNESFIINQIKISGVKMNDETTTFIPYFYYGSVNIDESYFYVDSSNRLQFNLIANDNNTEWIELRFFILYKTTENRSIQFKSNINGVSQGYIHLAYWGWETTDIYFPYYEKTTTTNLPQGFVIYTLSIIISDLDITYYDICEGYITNLKLLWAPGGFTPVILIGWYINIASFIMILIPIIVLVAPSLVISIKFGKKAIIPMFMLMSFICVATNLIPIWLFFIMMIASGTLLFTQYKRDDN